MVSEDELRNAISYLEDFGYNNPRIEGSSFRVGEEPDDIISIPVNQIAAVDTPDQEYTRHVKIHIENQIEKAIDIFDIDRPAAGERMFNRFTSGGDLSIMFGKDKIYMEQGNIWSTDYTAYK